MTLFVDLFRAEFQWQLLCGIILIAVLVDCVHC